MQHFRYWMPSSTARACLVALHPATLVILLFHPQLLQVTPVPYAPKHKYLSMKPKTCD